MTPLEARDEMLTVFRTVWAPRHVIWPDIPGDPPTAAVVYARVSVKTATGRQASLTGGLGTTMYEDRGTLWIEIYAPNGAGGVEGLTLAQTVRNAYRDAVGSVWYRNVRMIEMGASGAWQRFDVKADFEYTDVR